jgi:hypothetical protein
LRTRTRNALVLMTCATLLGAALVFAARSTPTRPVIRSALQAVPSHASVVLSLQLDRLRSSPFAKLISDASASHGGQAPSCSLHQLDRVRQAAVWMPEGSDRDFGLAALGELSQQELVSCAREAIGARGGVVRLTQAEGFTLVEDQGLGDGAATLAVREAGPVLLARPVPLARMMAALDGRGPSAMTEGAHARMRAAIEMDGDAVLTAVASDSFRRQIRALGGEQSWAASILALAAVLQAGPTAHLRVLVWCDGAPGCDEIARVLNASVGAVRESMAMRVAGVAGLLQSAVIRSRDGQMVIDVKAPADEVVTVLQRVWRWDETLGGGGAVATPPRPVVSRPDEVLRAPRPYTVDGGR